MKPEKIRKTQENSGAMMVDSGVDSEASSPDSGGSEKIPVPPRPDLLLETAETLLALSGKPSTQNSISPRKGSAFVKYRSYLLINQTIHLIFSDNFNKKTFFEFELRDTVKMQRNFFICCL